MSRIEVVNSLLGALRLKTTTAHVVQQCQNLTRTSWIYPTTIEIQSMPTKPGHGVEDSGSSHTHNAPRTGCGLRIHLCTWCEQVLEWAQRAIFIVACCQCEALHTCSLDPPSDCNSMHKYNHVHTNYRFDRSIWETSRIKLTSNQCNS